MKRAEMQKVTVLLPKELIRRATRVSGQGLTPTLRKGLEAVVTADAFDKVRQLRGKVKLSIDVARLRED